MQFAGSRLQLLPTRDYLFLAFSGQWASKNLDSSEKFSMGGPYGVRGYPSPESPSDCAVITTMEYRKQVPIEALPGDLVFSLFGDYGVARQHQDPLLTDVDNIRKLVSYGLGVTSAVAAACSSRPTSRRAAASSRRATTARSGSMFSSASNSESTAAPS